MTQIALPDKLKVSDPLEYLCRADEQGLLIAPDETFDTFSARIDKLIRELPENLPRGLPEVSAPVRDQAGKITEKIFGFRTDWLPAYYSTHETGHFSAGVSVILNDCLPLVYLSGAFLKGNRHRGYDAIETLAHESVHAARIAFPDRSIFLYDEYFPCQVHASRFRRLAGNSFRKWYIPALFFIGLTAAAVHPLFLTMPLAVMLTESVLLVRMRTAKEKLRSLGLQPGPVLLRLSDAEIGMLANGKLPSCLSDKTALRFRLFFRRFALDQR